MGFESAGQEGTTFSYRQIDGSIWTWLPLDDKWAFFLAFTGEDGHRKMDSPNPTDRYTFSREHWAPNIELHHTLSPDVRVWGGIYLFTLTERNKRPDDLPLDENLKRHEPMFDTGVAWDVTDKFTFSPAIYFDSLDNKDDFTADLERSNHDSDVKTKIALPFQYRFSPAALALIDPTLILPDRHPRVNVQFQIFF